MGLDLTAREVVAWVDAELAKVSDETTRTAILADARRNLDLMQRHRMDRLMPNSARALRLLIERLDPTTES